MANRSIDPSAFITPPRYLSDRSKKDYPSPTLIKKTFSSPKAPTSLDNQPRVPLQFRSLSFGAISDDQSEKCQTQNNGQVHDELDQVEDQKKANLGNNLTGVMILEDFEIPADHAYHKTLKCGDGVIFDEFEFPRAFSRVHCGQFHSDTDSDSENSGDSLNADDLEDSEHVRNTTGGYSHLFANCYRGNTDDHPAPKAGTDKVDSLVHFRDSLVQMDKALLRLFKELQKSISVHMRDPCSTDQGGASSFLNNCVCDPTLYENVCLENHGRMEQYSEDANRTLAQSGDDDGIRADGAIVRWQWVHQLVAKKKL